jgi:hypothetical protein
MASEWVRIAGPALFGLFAGGLYGYATVMMDKPMAEGTTGWTESGKKLVLTRRVAAHGSLGAALLTIADENAVETTKLRKAMLACEQLLDMQQKADTVAAIAEAQGDEIARERRDEFTDGRDEAEFVAVASKYRDVCIALLTNGMADNNIPMSLDGIPHSHSLRYAMSSIIQSISDVVLNIGIAVRKWRG